MAHFAVCLLCGDQYQSTITLANQGITIAGVDLSELVKISTSEAHKVQFLVDLKDAFASFSKPIIAAVVGFAVGSAEEIKPCLSWPFHDSWVVDSRLHWQ
jgi:enoyl-CoA hydratase/carnithine racemase